MTVARNDVEYRIGANTRRLGRDLTGAERRVKRHTENVEGRFKRAAQSIDRKLGAALKSPFAGLIGGAAVLAAGKKILDFKDKLAALQVQGRLTDEQTLALENTIYRSGNVARQSYDGVLDAVTEIVNKTGDMNLAMTGIEGIAVSAKATSSDILDISKVASSLYVNMGITGDQMQDAFNILAVQGKNGSFVFSELAGQAERLTAAAGALDLRGLEDLKQYGAFLQMIRPSFGSAEEASTMVKNIMVRIQTEAKKIKKVVGFDVFDKSGNMKDLDEIIKGLVSGTGGDISKLTDIFGEAALAFTVLNREYKDTGGFETFEQHIKKAGSNELWNDFLIKSKTGKNTVQALGNVMRRGTDLALAPAIDSLSESLNKLLSDPQDLQDFEETLKAIGTAIKLIADGTTMAVDGWTKLIGLWSKVSEDQANWMFGMSPQDLASGKKAGFRPLRAAETYLKSVGYLTNPTSAAVDITKGMFGHARNLLVHGGETEGNAKTEVNTEITVNAPAGTTVDSQTKVRNGTGQSSTSLKRGVF